MEFNLVNFCLAKLGYSTLSSELQIGKISNLKDDS